MKRGGLLLLLIACAAAASAERPVSPPNEVLVTFYMPKATPTLRVGSQRNYRAGSRWEADLLTRQRVRKFARDHGLKLRDGWPVAALGVYCAAFSAGSVAIDELQRAAQALPYVQRVQLNQGFKGMARKLETHRYNDPLFSLQFGKHADNLVALHGQSRGAGVRVGIVDSQVDADHPDLIGQIRGQEAFAGRANRRDLGHGTAMAGIIAAADDNRQGVVGVAPEADVHVFGACRTQLDETRCDTFNIAKALQAAIDERMQILNMSLAGPYDQLLSDLIGTAQRRGVIVVAAENLADPGRNFPASEPGVFAVSGALGFWFTYPEQLTTQAGGGYQVFRGSSVSAAGFSGVAALLAARNGPADLRASLTRLKQGCSGHTQAVLGEDVCL